MDRLPSVPRLNIQEPFSKIFGKATSLFGFSSGAPKAPALDGEIVYCKNNVCVHHADSDEPVPGYLSLRCSVSELPENQTESTLILHWVPNITIRKNPKSVDSPLGGSPRNSSATLNLLDTSDETPQLSNASAPTDTLVNISSDSEPNDSLQGRNGEVGIHTPSSEENDNQLSVKYIPSQSSAAGEAAASSEEDFVVITKDMIEMNISDSAVSRDPDASDSSTSSHRRPVTLTLSAADSINGAGCEADNDSLCSSSTGGPDSDRSLSPTSMSEVSSMADILSLTETAESIAETHNLMFPSDTNQETYLRRNVGRASLPTRPSVFSVNLSAMRSLRLFFSEDSASSGQLVIASRESQYKIFHFYNGGLDKLAEILEEWNLFHNAKRQKWRNGIISPFSRQFRVVKPEIGEETDRHPEECMYQKITPTTWKLFMNEQGQICDELSIKKAVFFGGMEAPLRKEIWPFLLQYYPYNSTFEQRDEIRNTKYLKYHKIKKKREKLSKNETWKANFWRNVQNTVEKDVVRTDRAHAYYKGEGNANVEILKEILLNYAVAHPHLGYTQGMSDLLSPILVEVGNECDAYWCFVGLMQRTIFHSQPKDQDMDRQLLYLKELLRLMFPKFYHHLMDIGDALGLLFVHRWILLCFKREFAEQDALAVWETCWANIQTDYFHLFVALAIISSYSGDILQEKLPADEMLLHFSNLSHHMNGKLIIVKARALMHQFRLLEKIPCTVQDLCSTNSAGMWDSGHVPAIECVGHDNIDGCPYLGVSPSRSTIDESLLDLS